MVVHKNEGESAGDPDALRSFSAANWASSDDAAGGTSADRRAVILTYKRRKCSNGSGSGTGTGATVAQDYAPPLPPPSSQPSQSHLHDKQVCDPKGGHPLPADSDDASYQHWRNALQHLCQALSGDEGGGGGIQSCIRDALVNLRPQSDSRKIAEETPDCCGSHKGSSLVLKESVTATDPAPVHAASNGSSSDATHLDVTSQCRQALSNLIMSQKFASLCTLLFENFHEFKFDKIIDFSLIDTRMKEGAYEQKPALFSSDIQQFWRKLHVIGTEMVSLANNLSELSRISCRDLAGCIEGGPSVDGKDELIAWDPDWQSWLELVDAPVYAAGTCGRCGRKSDGRDCLVCDSCEEVFHVSCIKPAVKEIPHKNWYCSNCSEIGAEIYHDDCGVCEKLNAAAGSDNDGGQRGEESCDEVDEGPGCSPENRPRIFDGDEEASCTVCKDLFENGDSFLKCGHAECPKYYHSQCLTNKESKSYGPRWYGPCCLCRVCLTDKDDDKVVLCDACDYAYHNYCMNPPLNTIPSGQWFCKKCAAGIKAIHEVKRVRRDIVGEGRRRGYATLTKKSRQNVKKTDDRYGGMDILLTAAKAITFQEELATRCMKC